MRPYSWGRELRALGTDAKLELKRDYQRVDLDGVLRRKENTEAWIFPQFARDVASRRIAVSAGNRDPAEFQRWLDDRLEILGADEELGRYCKDDAERLLPKLEELPQAWREFVRDVYRRSRYRALVVGTWIQQALGRGEALSAEPPVSFADGEWAREWWQKERREAILVQAASRCRQRRLYGGMDTILTMTGSNILVFISLCREIWDSWERANAKGTNRLSTITPDIQSQAIWTVSEEWVGKQTEFPDGNRRKDFVVRLGVGVRRALLRDAGLVYPGHTGFSLLLEEYESGGGEEVRRFLDSATDFGALVSLPHTTKEKNRRQRRKWYLFPILCPHFEIPAVRTKEPYYARLAEVERWISNERPDIDLRRPHSKPRPGPDSKGQTAQLDLFVTRPRGKAR